MKEFNLKGYILKYSKELSNYIDCFDIYNNAGCLYLKTGNIIICIEEFDFTVKSLKKLYENLNLLKSKNMGSCI